MTDLFDLKGKAAIVTGGNGGIGLVLRFRSSHHIAASSFANFGIKGALANY
jgi:hypothetical protein